jgi:hypothetical protein
LFIQRLTGTIIIIIQITGVGMMEVMDIMAMGNLQFLERGVPNVHLMITTIVILDQAVLLEKAEAVG